MRKYLAFSVVAFPAFLGHFSSTSIAVAFPPMVNYYQTSLVLAGWVLSIYHLVSIGVIPLTARLSDTAGRRSTLMLCLSLFTIGSFLSAVAPNIYLLIASRVIQAAGAGGFISAATGIIYDQFPEQRQQFIGLLSSIAAFGNLVGPNVGGVMVEYLGWQSVFWINVPIGLVSVVLFKFMLKPDEKKGKRGDLDFVGVGLLAGFVSSIMISLTLFGKDYHVPIAFIVLIALTGVVLLGLFLYRAKHTPGAVVTSQMLTSKPFLAANAYNFAFGACGQGGIMALLPLYATSIYGMSVLQAGLVITPRSVGMIVASIFASFLIMKWGYHKPIIIGSLTMSVAFVMLGLEPTEFVIGGLIITPFVMILFFGLLVGIGSGMVSPASNNACIELMPDKAASITGLRQISRQMGQAIGVAISTLVLEYSSSMARGFTILFFGFTSVLLIAMIAVFYMPESPSVKPRAAIERS